MCWPIKDKCRQEYDSCWGDQNRTFSCQGQWNITSKMTSRWKVLWPVLFLWVVFRALFFWLFHLWKDSAAWVLHFLSAEWFFLPLVLLSMHLVSELVTISDRQLYVNSKYLNRQCLIHHFWWGFVFWETVMILILNFGSYAQLHLSQARSITSESNLPQWFLGF